MLQKGTILAGRYEILEHIGSGGMADVYKARCHKLNRYVAIKVLRQEYCDNESFVRKFTVEAQSTAGLIHPNIVNIYDAGNEEGIHYIVMELAEGMTLKRYIRRYGRLSARETVDFAIQIASGLQAAHEHHIIHRDIKPQNILVSDSGTIKVTDFGIARAATGDDTISSSAMGSVRYLSPEQARGGYADERSDIYSLGITIYEMATGKVPFDGENTVAIALMHLRDEITPPRCYFPDIPSSLEKIILKCTMKQPEQRYQSAAELILDLQKVFLSPDGNYVYVDPLVDDSPTIQRNKEDIEKIRKSLAGTERKRDVEEQKSRVEEEGEEEEDYKDDASMNPKLEKLILVITIAFGVLVACIVFYLVRNSLHLFRTSSNKGTTQTAVETTTEAPKEATTESKPEETKYTKMPNLIGLTKNAAEDEMKALGLKADFAYEDGSSSADSDLIVQKQQYNKGDAVAIDSTVKITLGKKDSADTTTTAEKVEIPAMVNYTEKKAEKELTKAGLKVKKAYATSDTVKEGYVIKQSPKGGTIVNKGFAVTITISKGVGKTTVPSLIGVSQSVAERELNQVGLKLGTVSYDYSGEVGVGDVISQGIESGTSVDKGTKVSVVLSLGEQESYRYEGSVNIEEQPFDEGASGSVKLVLKQDSWESTIYSKSSVSNDDFPLNITFEGDREGGGTVIMYVNGKQYNTYSVNLSAISD
ncbi:MAG: Stk1 family PASTA domain-containing Ser/Thr kinase [Anaerobutyricum sp.]